MNIPPIPPVLKTHLGWVLAVSALLLGLHSWLAEHDARLLAQQVQKVAESNVKSLQDQLQQVKQTGNQKVVVIQQKAAAVKTPQQAIAAIPDVSTIPLHTQPIPSQPTEVAVDALALYQTLAAAQITAVKLDTCEQSLTLEQGVVKQKDDEISALKHPKFWARVKSTSKLVGTGIAIGLIIAKGVL